MKSRLGFLVATDLDGTLRDRDNSVRAPGSVRPGPARVFLIR